MIIWGNGESRVVYNSIAVIVALLGIIGCLIYFYFINEKNNIDENLFRIIPAETSIIISYQDTEPILDWVKSAGISNFVEDDFINEFEKLNNALILVFNDANILSQSKVLLCLHPSVDTFQVYSLVIQQEKIEQNLALLQNSKILKKSIDIEGQECYELALNGKTIVITYTNNYLLISNQQRVIAQYIQKTDVPTTPYEEVVFEADNVQVFINYGYLNSTIKNMSNSVFGFDLSTFKAQSLFSFSSNQEVSILNGEIQFDIADKSLNPYISNNLPAENSLLEVLPENNLGFIQISYDNVSNYLKSIQSSSPKVEIDRKYGVNLNLEIETWLGKEMNISINPIKNALEKFVFVKTYFPERALKMIENMARVDQAQFPDFDFIESYKNQNIYFINDPSLIATMCGPLAKDIQRPYCYIFDDIILFTNKLESIKQYIDDRTNSALFYNQEMYSTLNNYLNKANNILVYINVDGLKTLAMPNGNLNKSIQNNKALVFEIINNETGLVNNILFVHNKQAITANVAIALKTKLDAPPSTQPYIVSNHNTNAFEIIVQDQKHNLYLISNKGKILWKKNIGEAILSDISQIDFYGNKKLQLVFNTASKIHCIDRLGNWVTGFPIVLPSSATAGLLLTDYNQQSELRMFIPLLNNNIVGYTIKGKPLSGWDPQKEKEFSQQSIQYTFFDNKDYLISCNTTGKVNIFNRRGRKIKEIDTKDEAEYYAPFYFTKSTTEENSYWLSLNNKGHIIRTYFDGKQNIIENPKWSNVSRLYVEDILPNIGKEWIVFEKDAHYIYTDQQLISSYTYNTEIKENVFFGSLGSNNQNTLFVSDKILNQVFAFDNEGTLMKGFPKEGSTKGTVCNLYNDTIQYLVIGSNDGNVLAYTLN